MTIAQLLRIPCTITTPSTTTDVYGDQVTDYDTGTSVTTTCYLASNAAAEVTADGGQVSTWTWTLYLAADMADAIAATSRVTLNDGRVLEVDAPPRQLLDARTGTVDHLEVSMRLVS